RESARTLYWHDTRPVRSQGGGASLGRSRQLLANDVSFDHLLGAGEQGRENFKTESLRGRNVYDEIELGWLLDRDVAGLRPAQNFVEEIAGASVNVHEARSVGQEPTPLDILPGDVARRQSRAHRQGTNDVTQYERVRGDINGIGALLEPFERGRDVFGAPDCDREALKAEFGGGCLNLTRFLDIHGILVVEQNGKAAQSGDHLAKQFEPFGGHVRRHNRKAGHITAGPRQTGDEPAADRVADDRGDDRDRRCRSLRRQGRLGSVREDNIDLEPDELGGDFAIALIATFRPAVLDRDGAALDPAKLAQALHKRGDHMALP